ncbi:MAG: hypothetical protein DRI48_00825 [Chloroflexi bacterium]|nr:MAG: hypothetical protein DRI48_00825 [Chloroflexota bacterium]
MRKFVPLIIVLLLIGTTTGCGGAPASPTVTSTPLTSPTTISAQATDTVAPSASETPSGPASCVQAPLEFEAEPRIPSVTEEDHVHGPADAPITFIEYADFQ